MFPWFCYFYSMKFLANAKVYSTDSGVLLKENITREDLEDGWTRFTVRKIYYRGRAGDYWMYVERLVIDRTASIVDRQDYCYVVEEDYIRTFNKMTETP